MRRLLVHTYIRKVITCGEGALFTETMFALAWKSEDLVLYLTIFAGVISKSKMLAFWKLWE